MRIEYEGALYHVLARGNEKRPIFTDSDDYERFLDIFCESLALFDVQCLVLVLMRNHYHAILRTLKPSLSTFMHRFNVAYSTYYNRCHNRVGHLYQGRYKAIVVEKDAYLVELSRYVHLNPLRVRGWITKPAKERAEHLAEYP